MRRAQFIHSTLKIAVVCLFCFSTTLQADLVSDTDTGKRTMSKFMVNLAKFVTWPDASFADPAAPYKYCIFGNDVMGENLNTAMDGKKARGRGFEITRMDGSNTDALSACHVVFISFPSTDQISPVIDKLTGQPILTVGEIENFAGYGGMIGFYGKGRKVALAINKKRLEGGGLKGSSKLFRASTM